MSEEWTPRMSEKVLDASVLLALLLGEPLPSAAERLFRESRMCAVNVAEVYAKLAHAGQTSFSRCDALLKELKSVEPFTLPQARMAGNLRAATAHAGLSLGDRACLALASELQAEVFTCDKAWSQVHVGLQIYLLR